MVIERSSAALIVVDVQNGFVSSRAQHVISPIKDLLASWYGDDSKEELLTLFSRFINPPGSQWERLIGWERLRSESETDIYPELIEFANKGLVFDKVAYSCFTPDVSQTIQDRKLSTIVICGIDTDSCVLATAMSAFDLGLTPVVVDDCCASHAGEELHEMGLTLLRRNIGKKQVISSDQIHFQA